MKLSKSLGEREIRLSGKQSNVTFIHSISYKPHFSIDEVLQRLVDKYQITYHNIWGEGMVRPYLVEFDFYAILEPLIDEPNLKPILHQKDF